MPFIPTPNCVQAELIYSWQGQVCETVLHYVKESPWDTDTMSELAEGLKDTWNTYIKVQMSNTLSLTSIKITSLESATAPVITYSTGLPLTGSSSATSVPNNAALVITKRTLLRGRSYRGRLYHPGIVETQRSGNTVLSSVVSDLRNAYENFLGITLTIAGTEALLVVLSLRNGGVARTEGVATLVNNLTSDGVIDSQRRRLPGRGA